MKFTILTLFPEILQGFFQSSIMARSITKGLVDYRLVNIRDYARDKHRTCDDAPYGGGAGMVLKPEPLAAAFDEAVPAGARRIYLSPAGRLWNQTLAEELAAEEEIVLLCGRYEGVDQRIIDSYIDLEVSVGDYVLSSGETAALVVVDTLYRLLEGVISTDSLAEESHSNGLLEYPHYTRPEEFRGARVPDILLSGHHAKINKWRVKKSLEKTLENRPELIDKAALDSGAKKILDELEAREDRDGSN